MLGVLLASAYPDRIAQLRADGDGYQYQLSNGRSAVLPREDSLVGTEWLAVAELGGQVGEPVDRIYSASALNPNTFSEILSLLVTTVEHVEWDYRKERFIAERRQPGGQHPVVIATAGRGIRGGAGCSTVGRGAQEGSRDSALEQKPAAVACQGHAAAPDMGRDGD